MLKTESVKTHFFLHCHHYNNMIYVNWQFFRNTKILFQTITVTKKASCKKSSNTSISEISRLTTGWKLSRYGVFSGPYFPVFGPEKTPYLDTFHAVNGKITEQKITENLPIVLLSSHQCQTLISCLIFHKNFRYCKD